MAALANLLIDQGASFSSTITVFNSDDTVFDLTGFTGASQVRKSYSSSSASATFTVSSKFGLFLVPSLSISVYIILLVP